MSVRSAWSLAVCLAGAAALVLIAVGVTYLTVNAGSLPAALGKIAGSSDHRTVRGFFAVMVGGLLLLVTIMLNQFKPGGPLAGANDLGDSPTPERKPAVDEPHAEALTVAPASPPSVESSGGTEYIEDMEDDLESDPIIDRTRRHREERRAVEEAGGGESEGFELAEEELIEHASHGDDHTPARIMQDAVGPDEESVDSVSGESDEEHLPD